MATIYRVGPGRYFVQVKGKKFGGTFEACRLFCQRMRASWVCGSPPKQFGESGRMTRREMARM